MKMSAYQILKKFRPEYDFEVSEAATTKEYKQLKARVKSLLEFRSKPMSIREIKLKLNLIKQDSYLADILDDLKGELVISEDNSCVNITRYGKYKEVVREVRTIPFRNSLGVTQGVMEAF